MSAIKTPEFDDNRYEEMFQVFGDSYKSVGKYEGSYNTSQEFGDSYKKLHEFDYFVKHKPIKRISRLKWWFILLIILGMTFLISVLVINVKKVIAEPTRDGIGLIGLIVQPAFAEDVSKLSESGESPKSEIILGIFSALGIVYFVAIYKVFFSTNPNNVDSATDLIKTLTGFFVGVGVTFFN